MTQKILTRALKGQANDDLCLWSPRNHHDRVPCGTSVTAVYYRDWMQKLCRKIHKNWPDFLRTGHSFCMMMHARTWPRLWLICWVCTSGKCYLTHHTVQTWVHQTLIYSPGWKSPCVDTIFVPRIGFCSGYPSHPRTEQSGTLNGIANLLRHWDAVIEKQGDYIEGL